MSEPELPENAQRVIETVRQGTNPHLFWCLAKRSDEDKGRPCLMIKDSAVTLGLKLSVDEASKDVILNGPPALMVSLMQDAYHSRDGKPFELRIAREAITSMTSGDDFIALIM